MGVLDRKEFEWYINLPCSPAEIHLERSGYMRWLSAPQVIPLPMNETQTQSSQPPKSGTKQHTRRHRERQGKGSDASKNSSGNDSVSNSGNGKSPGRAEALQTITAPGEDNCFFELCVGVGKFKVHLGEANVTGISSDIEFFRVLADTYHETQTRASRFRRYYGLGWSWLRRMIPNKLAEKQTKYWSRCKVKLPRINFSFFGPRHIKFVKVKKGCSTSHEPQETQLIFCLTVRDGQKYARATRHRRQRLAPVPSRQRPDLQWSVRHGFSSRRLRANDVPHVQSLLQLPGRQP